MDVPAHGYSVSVAALAWRLFGTWIFRCGDILAWDHYGTGVFWHKDILEHRHFGTGKFWQHARQCGHFRLVILAPVHQF